MINNPLSCAVVRFNANRTNFTLHTEILAQAKSTHKSTAPDEGAPPNGRGNLGAMGPVIYVYILFIYLFIYSVLSCSRYQPLLFTVYPRLFTQFRIDPLVIVALPLRGSCTDGCIDPYEVCNLSEKLITKLPNCRSLAVPQPMRIMQLHTCAHGTSPAKFD